MGFLGVLATIGKILLGIVIFVVVLVIVILVISCVKVKKDEENEDLARRSDEDNTVSARLLEHMSEDGRITKEKRRRIEKEIKKSPRYGFSNNRIVKKVIEEVSNDMLKFIEESNPYHTIMITINRRIAVFSDHLCYWKGHDDITVCFDTESLYDLNSSSERKLLAEIIAEGIKKQILIKCPQDPTGNVSQIQISYNNCTETCYHCGKNNKMVYYVEAILNYTWKNHNYKEKDNKDDAFHL